MSIHDQPFVRKSAPIENMGSNDRRPPFNLECEQALLGALLIHNQAAEHIPELVAEHFFDGLHGRIFDAMSKDLLNGRAFSPVTLAERFRSEIVRENLNGAQYLGRLAADATSILNVRDYARTIIECSQRRALIVICEDVAARAFDPNDPSSPAELIEHAERQLFHASTAGKTGAEVEYADAIRAALNNANVARMNGGKLAGLSTGFRDLDNKLGGMAPGNLIVIAGRPGMGKTALALNIANHVAQACDFVHFFSMEMSPDELGNRQLAEFSGVSSDKLRRGAFDEKQMRDVMDAAGRLEKLDCVIDRTGGISIATLSAKARRMARKRKTKLIVIDYLQLMGGTPGKGSGNRVQEISEITMGLKALAIELQIPIIALSQLSRQVESRPDKRPMLSDLRESGSIEQDADAVLFVYREEYYIERTEPDPADPTYGEYLAKLRAAAGKAEVIFGKQRHGAVGIVEMAFDGSLTRFSDLAKHEAAR